MEGGRERRPVSLIVPVWNEERTIGALLDSVLGQTRVPDEVIIVDGQSSDRTCAIVEEFVRRGHPIALLHAGRAHPGEGRNLGVLASAHDAVAFTDAGIRLAPRWLEKLSEPLERDASVDVVYGTYEPVLDTFFKECAALAYVPPPIARDGGRIRGPSVVSCLMKKSVWKAVGGFPPYRAAEDLIFMEEVATRGFTIAYAPEAVAHWQVVADWRSMFRKFSLYSYHNLLAGRARHWHYGVARFYGVCSIGVLLAILHTAWWLLILPLMGLVRTVKTAFAKRHAFAFRDVFRVKRLLYLGALLLVLDLATAWGGFAWAVRGRPGAGWRP
jgi:glycosyltransferase involved in cell wall biosynthesis